MGKGKYSVPKPAKGDTAHALAKGVIAELPVVGGVGAELFQRIIQPPLDRRREEWMEEVADGLRELEKNGLHLDALASNNQFVSATMQASVIALRTHMQEKRRALRNALLNVAKAEGPDESLQSIFFGFIDDFTDWHIKILRLFQKPTDYTAMTGTTSELVDILEAAYPELAGHQDLYDAVWRDLSSRQLVTYASLHGKMGDAGLKIMQKRTSRLGDLFLSFIAEPE